MNNMLVTAGVGGGQLEGTATSLQRLPVYNGSADSGSAVVLDCRLIYVRSMNMARVQVSIQHAFKCQIGSVWRASAVLWWAAGQ
jgi:hypothetical protein